MTDEKDKKTETDVSKVVAGAPVEPKKRVSNADDDGFDMDTLKQTLKLLKDENDQLKVKLNDREQEDADTVRKVIVQLTKGWPKPFSLEELKDATLEDLDNLHMFVQRAPASPKLDDAALKQVAEKMTASPIKVRVYPKLTKDSKSYNTEVHSFAIGGKN